MTHFCKRCGHASGYHGPNLKQILDSIFKQPCKAHNCDCDNFVLNKEFKR